MKKVIWKHWKQDFRFEFRYLYISSSSGFYTVGHHFYGFCNTPEVMIAHTYMFILDSPRGYVFGIVVLPGNTIWVQCKKITRMDNKFMNLENKFILLEKRSSSRQNYNGKNKMIHTNRNNFSTILMHKIFLYSSDLPRPVILLTPWNNFDQIISRILFKNHLLKIALSLSVVSYISPPTKKRLKVSVRICMYSYTVKILVFLVFRYVSLKRGEKNGTLRANDQDF